MRSQTKLLVMVYAFCLVYTAAAKLLSQETSDYEHLPRIANVLQALPIFLAIAWGILKFGKYDVQIGPVDHKKRYRNPKQADGGPKTLSAREYWVGRETTGKMLYLLTGAFVLAPFVFGYFLLGILLSGLLFRQAYEIKYSHIAADAVMDQEIAENMAKENEGKPKRGPNAGFEDPDNLSKLNSDPKNSSLGLWLCSGHFRNKFGGLITVAPPGSGKGACVIIPNLLLQPYGSYVLTDPKGELACITARAQTEMDQKVYILDPWNVQRELGATHGIQPTGFNPFDMLRLDMEDLPDNCEMIASYLIPPNPQAREPYWEERGRSVIKNFLVHIITALPKEEQNFWTLYNMLRLDDDELGKTLDAMRKNPAYDGLVAAAANEFFSLMRADNTFGSILSTAHNGTRLFESPALRASLLKSDFNPFDLPNGNVTLYIVIPDKYMKSHAAYTKMVIGLCSKAVNSKPKNRVIFMLDEAGNMLGSGFEEDISRLYSFGRGQGIIPWTFWQGYGQIERLYGQEFRKEIDGMSRVTQVFGLENDHYSQEIISAKLGRTSYRDWEESLSTNAEGEQSVSGQWKDTEHDLMTPDQVGREMDILMIVEGRKFIVPRLYYFNYPDDGLGNHFNRMADPACGSAH